MSEFTLEQLQQEQAEWVARNFPGRKDYMPLLGMMEELGELSHAQLKGEQGIRYTPEVVLAKKKDAVGDITVYTADYCTATSVNLAENVCRAGHLSPPGLYKTPDEVLRYLQIFLGEICYAHGKQDAGYHVGEFINCLQRYCQLHEFTLIEAVEFTWSKVKQRNWIANPIDAHTKVEGSL